MRSADLHADRTAVLDVWRGHVQLPPEAKYDWFYLGNPYKSPTVLVLTHGAQTQPVGVAGLGTRTLHVQGEEVSAGILADLVVHPEHRTLYPALLLQKQMQRTALGMHSVVYGLPNQRSTPIVRRLGYIRVGELIRYAKVLRHGTYLDRRLPHGLSAVLGAVVDRAMPWYHRPYRVLMTAWQHAWLDTIDERFDALWKRARNFNGVIGTRDAQFLSWRFLSQAGHHYRVFVVTPPGAIEIAAYAICEAEGRTLHIRDFLVDLSQDDHLLLLIHLLSREAREQGFSSLSLEFLGSRHLHSLLLETGMVERDKSAMYACFGPKDEARLRKLDWYMTSADDDRRFQARGATGAES